MTTGYYFPVELVRMLYKVILASNESYIFVVQFIILSYKVSLHFESVTET